MSLPVCAAPQPCHRLIPSRFPPVGLFDTVANAADLRDVLDLVGWTNDRMVAERLSLLPEAEWVFGRPNSSIVLAAFLHVAPGGMRFNGEALGAWYAADEVAAAATEVAHHLRREAIATGLPAMARTYRCYQATLGGEYVDTRGLETAMPDVFASTSYAASQRFGEDVRTSGAAGILYTSIRKPSGTNVVAYRPSLVQTVVQSDHFEISVRAADRVIHVTRLSTDPDATLANP